MQPVPRLGTFGETRLTETYIGVDYVGLARGQGGDEVMRHRDRCDEGVPTEAMSQEEAVEKL